ncbi:MAG: helix-turn-helix domain-containing protein, partial [Planctomycetota bacterium]|nr:helix-turn-helix domain-containing protein [Planctomycetota bacterium]
QYRRGDRRFTESARLALRRHPWPGTVRELINVIQRAVMLSDGAEIEPQHLGLSAKASLTPSAGRAEHNGAGELRFDFESGVHTADEVEKALIVQALEHARGNISRAAKIIGMNRSSFRYRLQRSGLEEFAQEVARR